MKNDIADHETGHTENVAIPEDVYALGQESSRDYALKLVDECYARYRKKVPAEATTETPDEKHKKRRRRKKTEE